MVTVEESKPDAHPLSRASSISIALMRHFGSPDFASLKGEELESVSLSPEQLGCLQRSRRWLALLRLQPETTLAVCEDCGAVTIRIPRVTLPKYCSTTPGCHGRISWAGRSKAVAA